MRLRWIGHRISADAGLVVSVELGLAAAHAIAHDAEHRMLHRVPKLSEVTIHVCPSAPEPDLHHDVLPHHSDGADS